MLNSRILKKIKLVNESEWVTVDQSLDEYSIRIKKLQLEDEGIPAIIFDQRDSSYNAFGYLYLKVHRENKSKALKLLNSAHE